MEKKISKVLIANRGEIAIRVMRTCRELGIKTVAVYSDADKGVLHTLFADEAIHIGPAPSKESYLVIDKIINAAKKSGADAIHPGYGFLSENAAFSMRCASEGIIFIGPTAESINMMGDKTKARELMIKHGVPVPPGLQTALHDIEEARQIAHEIGYPVLVKAAAGGGGKGMRIIDKPEEFDSGIRAAKSEALNAFGDDRVYVEKYLEEPHHVEFQVMADKHGNVIHIYDRECSIQRRHQKVIEEAPSPYVHDELRQRMAETAVLATKACNYHGAGTIEFLVDKHKKFYFLEMNTRLQVEHPVSESITGLDLVALQILVAEGKPLPLKQEDVKCQGHSIECRISAEDSFENFMPSTGTLRRYRLPSGPGVRVDSGVTEGQAVSINYDPLLAKLIVYAETREAAIQRMIRALEEYQISGLQTTVPFCSYVMKHPVFQSGVYDTHFIKNYFKLEDLRKAPLPDSIVLALTTLVKAFSSGNQTTANPVEAVTSESTASTWWNKRRN
jgi:acetyl-CoA carboxylase biotin carboxylase subunit